MTPPDFSGTDSGPCQCAVCGRRHYNGPCPFCKQRQRSDDTKLLLQGAMTIASGLVQIGYFLGSPAGLDWIADLSLDLARRIIEKAKA